MKYIASFDAGTTGVKGLLTAEDGTLHGEVTIPVATAYGKNGEIEQDPEEWWKAVVNISMQWWKAGFYPEDVLMVALSGQMQDFIPVDREGYPVRPAILYSDQRAEKQAKEIMRKIGKGTVTEITGNPFNGQMPFAKILWMKHVEPDKYEKTKCVLMSSKDYIIRKLTGKNVTDVTTASTSGIMNIRDCIWMYDWAEKLEVETSLLPELLFSDDVAGYVSKHASESTGLCVGVPVLCGAGDGGSTSVGAGAVNEGEIYAYIGTTGWIAASTGSIGIRSQGIFQLAHMPRKTYIAVAPLLNAGNVHKWIASIFDDNSTGVKSETYKLIEQQVEKAKPGSEGLLFLPYLNGERCPVQDPEARGCFIGLYAKTTRGDMCRAVLEGVAMSMRQNLQLLFGDKKIERMALIGGGSKTAAWCRIIADVCKTEVFVPQDADFLPSLGAASSACIRLGWVKGYPEFVNNWVLKKAGAKYNPDPSSVNIYEEAYKKYIKIYPSVKNLFK